MKRVKGKVSSSSDLKSFLRPWRRKPSGWTDKKIRAFVRLVQNGASPKSVSKQLRMSVNGARHPYNELKRAASNSYTLDRYLDEGRPLRYGKKVLAK